jgi:hypothetical protein
MKHVDFPQCRGRIGLAWTDITPPVGIYHRMWGAATHDRATGVHRPLRATALWAVPIRGDEKQTRVLVALDHCILDGDEITRIARAVADEVHIDPNQVNVTLSHTHGAGLMTRTRESMPGGDLIGPYLDEVAKRSAEAARKASDDAREATLLVGRGRCALAAHRDFYDAAKGRVVCGLDPEGPADDTVMVARIVADHGPTLGTIVNYACHPTTLAWDNTLISPDFVGALRETVESQFAAPCLFLQGASGDLGPRVGFVGDTGVADNNGRQLAFAALAALEALPEPGTRYVYRGPVISGAVIGAWDYRPLPDPESKAKGVWRTEEWNAELPYRPDLPTIDETLAEQERWSGEERRAQEKGDAILARDCRAKVERMTRQLHRLRQLPAGKTYPLPVHLWRWGDVWWLFVPGEHYQSLQTTLRARFPDQPIVVTTLTGNWQPGYVPPASTYGYGIYQEIIAATGAGSAELLIEAITRRMRAMSET